MLRKPETTNGQEEMLPCKTGCLLLWGPNGNGGNSVWRNGDAQGFYTSPDAHVKKEGGWGLTPLSPYMQAFLGLAGSP